MNIVILNECFLSKDHFERLNKLGEVKVFDDTTTEEKAIERLKDADIAVIDGFICPPTAKVLESTDKLK